MKKLLEFAEQGFTVISLMIYAGGLLLLLLSGGANESDVEVNYDTSVFQLFFIFIYIVTFFLLILRWKKVLEVFSKDIFIWVLLGVTLISFVWSVDPGTTLKDSIRLICSSLFGLYLAVRYSLKQQLHLLAWMFGIAVVLSFIFAVALPQYGIMGGIHAGKWRGIFLHKNGLGSAMVVSAMVFLLLAIDSKKNKWLHWCGVFLSVVLLVLSVSTSSLINLVLLVIVYQAIKIVRWRYDLMIPTLIATVTIVGSLYVWFINNAQFILGPLNKDLTLSGRTDMWPFVLDMIWKRPWLGYGYSAFWSGLNGESAYIWRATGWTPTHPHNGFLDLWLSLGFLGMLIFLFIFLKNLGSTIAYVRQSRNSEGCWPAVFITYLLLMNLTETNLLGTTSIFWILYIALYFSLLMPATKINRSIQSVTS